MSEIIRMLRDAIGKLEELRRRGELPEEKGKELEKLAGMLEELKKIRLENTIQSRIATSGRGAMFQLRKAFYAQLSAEKLDKKKSSSEWKRVATKLVEFLNEKGLSDIPTKIILEYDVIEEEGVKYLKFKTARIYYFELAGYYTLEL
ncbi:MAG: hypothetical protein DRJ51_07620 [Thermoprotei archaeon]|nr:MAG: hypothetical protein DRJ51_07620 [Thermoprotei archaeon]RLF02058.1 MAG: hypothetical protein DRJ59_04615 [Thermoprotei archaeon]